SSLTSGGGRQEPVVRSRSSGDRRLFLFILPTPHTLLYKTSSYFRAGKGNPWAIGEGKAGKY
ncbi:MAG: hypothetical protein ACKPH1_01350, partial [Microcystis panniformis]